MKKSNNKPKPVTTKKEFKKQHREQDNGLKKYLGTKRGKKAENRRVVADLKEASAMSLKATNCTARIKFATSAYTGFRTQFGNLQPGRHAFVTLTPKEYAVPLSEAPYCDWSQLQEWARAELEGLHYVGIVEAALYTNLPMTNEPTISWHVHAIVWGKDYSRIQAMVNRIAAEKEAILPDKKAAHSRRLKTPKDICRKTLYMLKAPLKDYRVWTKRPRKGEAIRYEQEKRELRPGDALKAYRVLAGISIDQLLFWGGSEGTSLAEKIIRDAHKRLQKFDDRRRAQIDSAINPKAD